MTYLRDTGCCGLDEIEDIDAEPEEILDAVCEAKYPRSGWEEPLQQAFLFFTDVVKYRNGISLAAYIEKHKLGTLYTVRPRRNPNTGNRIQMWTWAPDERALKRWWKARKKDDYSY